MKQKELVISIHDFTHYFNSELEEIITELNQLNLKKRSILVIPNYKHIPLESNSLTIDLLHQEVEQDNEICLHGYNHRAYKWFREFKDIDYALATEKLLAGKRKLAEVGVLKLSGFVPPYWKISKDGLAACKDQGFTFVASNPNLINLSTNKKYKSRPIWYWPTNNTLNNLFQTFDSFLTKIWHQNNGLVRIAIHPQDLHGKAKSFEHALGLIDYLIKEKYILSSYGNYLDSNKSK